MKVSTNLILQTKLVYLGSIVILLLSILLSSATNLLKIEFKNDDQNLYKKKIKENMEHLIYIINLIVS